MSGENAALFLSARVLSDPKEGKRRPTPDDDLLEQERRLRAYAEQMRYAVTRVFREIIPEFPGERPALKGLRTAMWLREVDVVLAASPDRLYRDPERLKAFLVEARTLGQRVEFLDVPPLYAWIVKEYGWPLERR
ncbi:MAG: recombinase family protein [Thermomicrobium sp.]|nr:recombinase family protein [Thermomicrobium sp.]MDW7982691.1 recombinase family protein [Thermomicrobium sp.]